MDKNIEFETRLRSDLENETSVIKFREGIFEDAWNNKNLYKIPHTALRIKSIKKILLIAACLLAISFGTTLAVSAEVRNMALDSVKSIFGIEKAGNSYKIVKHPSDMPLDYAHGGLPVNDANRDEAKRKLGFDFYLPDKVGSDYVNQSDTLGLSVFGISYMDILENQDTFGQALQDDKALNGVDNKTGWFICGSYSNVTSKYNIYASKIDSTYTQNDISSNLAYTTEKEIEIQGIKCTQIDITHGTYKKTTKEVIDDGYMFSSSMDDLTNQPTGINVTSYINWEYNGVSYSLMSPVYFELESATTFAKEYIKQLKQHSSEE